MNTESENCTSNEEQKRLWGQEYLSIHQRIEDASTRRWQATAMLVGGAFAAAGLIITKGSYEREIAVQTSILGGGIIISLLLFLFWFLKRCEWRIALFQERENYLEEKLGFYANRYVKWLDRSDYIIKRDWNKFDKAEIQAMEDLLGEARQVSTQAHPDKDEVRQRVLERLLARERIDSSQKMILERFLKIRRYKKPAERFFMSFVTVVAIVIWVALIMSQWEVF